MKKKYDSCVFKRDAFKYKTCYECGTMRKCNRKDKPKWYGRIAEQIFIGWYRLRMKIMIRRKFNGLSRGSIKNIIRHIRNSKKS